MIISSTPFGSNDILPELLKAKEIIVVAQTEKKKLIFAVNGASALIASHAIRFHGDRETSRC